MAKICDVCNRRGLVGNNRSHSNIATKRRQGVNLQTKRVDGTKLRVCTSCIRTAAKNNKTLAAS